jgi:tetratricopeptide (TPR) repeat protein
VQRRRQSLLIALVLVAATLAAFWRVGGNDFVAYDDATYVTGNAHVRAGLTAAGVRWAFTSREAANWHPLTWLSHMADVEVLGLAPGRHHAESLLLHALNAVLLFLVLGGATGALLPSAAAAALFALHPLHVESVAWAAERKDVLCALFWLLTLGAYVRYARRRTAGRYLVVVALFSLGLLAKPMLVTLPFVLILFDWWPLGRLLPPGRAAAGPPAQPAAALLAEKVPLLLLAAASSWVTLLAQQAGEAVVSAGNLPLVARFANAAVAYGTYLSKTLWPVGLSVFYRYPAAAPAPLLWGAALALLAAGTALVVRGRRTAPFLLVGWLWFLGTLVPVIGLVKVGAQFIADRYTYLPLVGIFIAAAWGGAVLARGGRGRQAVLGGAVAAALAICAALTWAQVGVWRDSRSLFEHALGVDPDNWLAHNNLGTVLTAAGSLDAAAAHYRAALRVKPDYETAHYNYANLLVGAGRLDEAAAQFREALRLSPRYAEASDNLGALLLRQGKFEEARRQFQATLEVSPDLPQARNNLGVALQKLGRRAEALPQFAAAVQLDPGFFRARVNLGLALAEFGRLAEAAEQLAAAERLDPADGFARFNRERVERALLAASGGR